MLRVMLRIQFRPCRVHERSRSCIAMITANRRQIRQLTYWCDARLPRTSSILGAPCRFSRSFGHGQMSSEHLRVDAQPSIGRKVVLGTAALSAIAVLVSAFAGAMSAYFWVAIGSALGGMARHWCTWRRPGSAPSFLGYLVHQHFRIFCDRILFCNLRT